MNQNMKYITALSVSLFTVSLCALYPAEMFITFILIGVFVIPFAGLIFVLYFGLKRE